MDPLYLSYSQANGVPQESKLSTYMNHQNSSSTTGLSQSLVTLSLEQPVAIKKENVGGTTYFYSSPRGDAASLDNDASSNAVPAVVMPSFTVYSGSPTHVSSLKETSSSSTFYVSEELRMEQLHKNALVLAQPDPEQYPDLPNELDNYRDLCPLKPTSVSLASKTQIMSYPASSYKATNMKTGIRYCLQRIHGYRLPNTKFLAKVELWKQLEHSNIVQLREVFSTKAFGDYSLIFVYDYHPGSDTLTMKHFSQNESGNGYTDPFSADPHAPRPYSHQKNKILLQQPSNLLPESTIWNYVIQLTSGLRAIHAAGLACRILDPNTILINGQSHLRINFLAIPDVLTYDSGSGSSHHLSTAYQQDDLTALGKLILALACRSLIGVTRDTIPTSLDLVTRAYSPDLRNLIMYLLTNSQQSQQSKNVTDLMPMIGARFYTQLDAIQARADVLENELAKEMENGRLCRLLVKLGTVNERPELNMDQTWSETGDRYMLKLFRDYLFHQVTEDGTPWVDMSHVVHCLNKLDAGVTDKICLMSRDGQSILVVSYSELKHCLEQSFNEIATAAAKHDIS